MGHSYRTLLRDTLKGHSCGTLSYETLVGYSCRTLLWDTLVGHSCGTLLLGTLRTRLPPKVTRQVSKTSVSYETSSKTHMSKSAKRAFRTRLPPKVKRKHPSEHTHHAGLPSSFASPAPPNNTRSHANPTVTATFSHESFRVHTSNAHKVLRLPRNVTSVTPRNLTIPCACDEISPHVSFNKICTTPHVWNDFDPF